MHGVLGVGIVFAEDEGLGDERAAGEQLGEDRVFVGLEDDADLGRDDDGAVEGLGCVGEVFVEAFPADGAGLLAAAVHVEAFFDFAAGFGDLGFDAVNLVAGWCRW